MLQWVGQLDRILRGEATRISAMRGGQIDVSARGLALVVVVLGVIYGACMGIFSVIASGGSEWRQIVASTVKVPMLFMLTLVVTFPSLYVFNALVGSRLTIHAVLRLLVAAMGVMLAILASFGTIVGFFSVSTASYPFMTLLNVAVFTIAGVLGLGFLLQTLQRMTEAQEEPAAVKPVVPPPVEEPESAEVEVPGVGTVKVRRVPGALERPAGQVVGSQVRTVFRIWVIVFALVGAQMGWVLRPFIGSPRIAFAWFRPRESNFFEGVFTALRHLIGG